MLCPNRARRVDQRVTVDMLERHARNPVGMNWCGHITDKALSRKKSVERSQISFAHFTASTFLGFPSNISGRMGPPISAMLQFADQQPVVRISMQPLSLATYCPAPVYGARRLPNNTKLRGIHSFEYPVANLLPDCKSGFLRRRVDGYGRRTKIASILCTCLSSAR